MNQTAQVEISARWETGVVAADQDARQALLVEVTAVNEPAESTDRRPVGLALVIDRSGSMSGGRLQAAIEAALGITQALEEADRLSLVTFDDTACTHFVNLPQDPAGRREARDAIAQLRTGGCTNLGGGWLAGARCAAALQDDSGFEDAHVLVLSDGQANRGLTDPAALARHAGEMASRGIYSSAAGIGDHYSPLQLDAIAEAGGGSLHDADSAQDIVDVVLGELGDVKAMTARDTTLHLRFPVDWRVETLAQAGSSPEPGTLDVPLGNLRAGRVRPVPLMVQVSAGAAGDRQAMSLQLTWTDALTGQSCASQCFDTLLRFVDGPEARSAPRDLEVVRRVSVLWQASLVFRAMRHNEAGDLCSASAVMQDNASQFLTMVDGLDDAEELGAVYERATNRVARRWDGRSKRAAMTHARKSSRNEADHRQQDGGGWQDQLFD